MSWITQYSQNVTVKKPLIGAAVFKFPTKDGIHQLVQEASAFSAAGRMTATFLIKPDTARFISAGGGIPKLRLYFQRRGDTWSGSGSYQWYRWWSAPQFCFLRPGQQTISVPLVPEQWQAVLGKMGTFNRIAFRDAVENPVYVGMTFGDDNGAFAHGAWAITEGIKFKLLSFSY